MKIWTRICIAACIAIVISFAAGFGVAHLRERGFYEPELSPRLLELPKSQNRADNFFDPSPLHYSAFANNRAFFDEAFAGAIKRAPEKKIVGAIVNHHLLGKHLIASVLNNLATSKQVTVALISPDHFMRGAGEVTLSAYNWQTPYGILESDAALIRRLAKEEVGVIDERPHESAPGRVEGEHGIANIIPFIKQSMPRARVVPIIVKDTLLPPESAILAERLDAFLPKDALVVASLDFSHTLPPRAAEFHDGKSVAVLQAFDENGAYSLDVDSEPAVAMLISLMRFRGARAFTLFDHTNSAELLNDFTLSDTTSYITGVFTKQNAESPAPRATLLSFGDIMLDRYVRAAIDKNGAEYPLKPIARLLQGNDITLANLEGGFTDFSPKPFSPNNTTFTFDPALVGRLRESGFTLMNLANNHSRDFGEKGFDQTRAYLEKAGIAFFGDFANEDGLAVIEEVRGMKIGFVGYHELSGVGFENALAEVATLNDVVDVTVVYTHWGREYERRFSKSQQETAHAFIDEGADAVIGSHPHVVQPIEVYKNRAIFYSLGNFIFDQTFSKETMEGLGIGAVFEPDRATYYLFPIAIRNLAAHLMDSKERDILLQNLADDSLASDSQKRDIASGRIVLK